jgi:hypothetical protein
MEYSGTIALWLSRNFSRTKIFFRNHGGKITSDKLRNNSAFATHAHLADNEAC